MLRRGQVVTAVAAVLSPLVFALGVPTVFPGGPSGGSHRPSVTDRRPLRGYAPSPRGAKLWVSPNAATAALSRTASPLSIGDRALLTKIARNPQAIWLTEWLSPAAATSYVDTRARAAQAAGAVPVFVLYAIPERDCGSYSLGGIPTAAGYRAWVDGIVRGLGGRRAVVIVEPDALAHMDCVSNDARRAERTSLIAYAVDALSAATATSVYIDAGHSRWYPASVMADRLRAAGVLRARGFALNVSAFDPTGPEVDYGKQIGVLLGSPVPFVVDTSRNGNGRYEGTLSWCNPPGRALGTPPTTNYPDPLVDALLWVKLPGTSDGTCRGGPAAGQWWEPYALGLASRASW